VEIPVERSILRSGTSSYARRRKSFSDRPLIYAVLVRSVLFALVFIAFAFIEKTI
jgi:hypothetical protein